MKIFKILAITLIAFALSMNNSAFSKNRHKLTKKSYINVSNQSSTSCNVAVVDLQSVLENSPKMNAINADRKNKLSDLTNFAKNARADVEKENNPTRKKALEDGYNKELNSRKGAIDKNYMQKLAEIDEEINDTIKEVAKNMNLGLVLPKSGVLDGGTDITSEIIKKLK